MVKKFLLAFILFCGNLLAQEVYINAYTDTSHYMIGDQIIYHLDIKSDKGIKIYSTSLEDSIKDVDIFDISNTIVSNKDIRYTVTLSKYDSAVIRIPSIEVRYLSGKDTLKLMNPLFSTTAFRNDSSIKTVYSNSIIFNIKSVKVNVQEEIKDIKSPKDLTSIDWLTYVVILFFLIITAGGGYLLYKKYKRKDATEDIEILPPYLIALRRLEDLDKKELHLKGKFKDYFSELTEILRKYYEDIYFFPALEMTSFEIINELKNKNITEKLITKSNHIFNISDYVKFAKRIPDLEDCRLSYSNCIEIIELTKPEIKEEVNAQ